MVRVWVLVLLVGAVAPAQAETTLEAGKRAFARLEYEKAIRLLEKALTEKLARGERIDVLRTLAFTHVAINQPARARERFLVILALDPEFRLDRTVSPRFVSEFEAALATLPPKAPVVEPPPKIVEVKVMVPAPPPPPQPHYRRAWPWVVLGSSLAAVVGLGFGLGYGLERLPSTDFGVREVLR